LATEPPHTYLGDYCAVDLEGVIAAGFKLSIQYLLDGDGAQGVLGTVLSTARALCTAALSWYEAASTSTAAGAVGCVRSFVTVVACSS
jgi:acyl-[acyl carrier protein]--UDP-N-acetylglucosamine O-acyltransferase